ncbi:LysR family transcriptional regulator [Parendozoicomonas haliclonae]|uniref:HTH-type transcriptional regulator DmlR n=1 Tax=Parendozoicomonas haliclonae TaxID=1960125 RepID=A0A1X7AR98_9GAMM|nr:LysR family transcriptional regulator [Parendozoicomonas haliclonae]SMA50619.1 HTH-type transcriptional regulator DmlR [Parendozoicomonas haliclonae]
MNFDHLKLFVRVAATNNISRAGQELGLSPAVASSYINKLEDELGVRLVHRTTRRVSLTEEGAAFVPYADEVLASVEQAVSAIGAGRCSPKGMLRVTAPASFGRMHLVPGLKGFLERYPELSVDLSLSDSIVDIVGGGFDLAIRDATLKDSSLVARSLAADKRIICASPAYIERYGRPEQPMDLKHHQSVILTGLENWSFQTPQGDITVKVSGRMRTDNGDAMRDASVNGMGLSLNSTWSVYQHLQQGTLVQVLEDYPLISGSSIWAVYPSSRQVSPKVKAFIDYYRELFGETPYWDRELSAYQA